ncbi:MAG: cytochrome c3 family protein, partial [Elusimicrobiota bacterium]
PVLYSVRPGGGPPVEPGTNPEIRLPATGDKVKVYGQDNRVECTSCHDPHDNSFGSFLVKPNADAALCVTCHQKSGYTASIHATSNISYTPASKPQTTIGEYSCRNCHKAHGASTAQAYLLDAAEENTCFKCHGAPPLTGAKDIRSQLAKSYRHPTQTTQGVHINPETDAGNLGNGKRHAECWDCHNPHQARSGTHATPGNAIGNVLLGQWGVEPSYGSGAWTAAVSYVKRTFLSAASDKEYQLCLKCHSYYAFGALPPGGSTDLSIAMNPNNRAVHPVRDSANNQTGSAAPKPLNAAQLSAPWTTTGSQTMSCSDCHGSDVASDPKGPHGSAAERVLKGPRKFWPKNAAGSLWTLNDIRNNANNWSTNLFCVNCHPLYSNGAWANSAHDAHENRNPGGGGMKCILCHNVVTHGSQRSRLIGYATEPAPYNYNGAGTYDKLLIRGFKKASGRNNYQKSNCYTSATGCHAHNNNEGGYDP